MIKLGGIFEKNNIASKLQNIENELLQENFWKDKNKVKKTVKEKKIYEGILNSFNKTNLEIKNLKDLHKLAEDENNEEILQECAKKLKI